MKKFLKKYYEQLHFNSMPEGVQTRFFEWVKKGTLTQDMQNWANDYLQHDTSGNLTIINGEYIPNRLPNTAVAAGDMTDDVAKQLFLAFHKTFSKMNSNLSKFEKEDPQSAEFVRAFFGSGKLFEPSSASTECVAGIDAILNLLSTNNNLQQYIRRHATDSSGKKLFNTQKDLTDLINDCRSGKYNTDTSVQSKIVEIANILSNARYDSNIPDDDKSNISAIDDQINAVTDDNAFALKEADINSDKLRDFREVWASKAYDQNQPGAVRQGLLQTLYYNKTIRSRFSKFDDSKIVDRITESEEKVNYQDKSKQNYVDPKVDDVLSPIQQIKKWATDTYSNTFKKYEQLRGGSIFFKQEAKYIFEAIDKCGIKPIDGLDALLSKKGDIEGKINNPLAREHFKWFTETMGPIAEKMPEAVKGAWNNSTQQKAIVRRLILEATKPGADKDAVEKAKTAMEIMTAMKYGMMTSKVMDALKQEDFKIFSDGGLSWNKNEGIQFITKCFDKSLRAAFLGVGYGITFVRNKIMMSKHAAKFHNRDNRGTGEYARAVQRENTTRRTNLETENLADRTERSNRTAHVAALGTDYTAPGAIENRRADRTTAQSDIDAANTAKAANQAGEDQYNNYQEIINAHKDKVNQIRGFNKQLNEPVNGINAKVAELETKFKDPATYAGIPPAAGNALAAQLQKQLAELQEKQTEIKKQRDDLYNQIHEPTYRTNYDTARRETKPGAATAIAHENYTNAENDRAAAQARYDTLDTNIKAFETGRARIEELTRAINDRQHALDNWPEENGNKMLELENYWNWLQTGATRTWRISTKAAQRSFDPRKNMLLQQHVSRHGMAA